MPVPDPITRQEQFLNAAATGDTSGLPDPITREEVYLDAIARNGSGGGGGGGGGSSGILILHVVEITGTDNVRLDKTWQEIWDAVTAGVIVAISDGYTEGSFSAWSCAPIREIAADSSYGLWSVYDINSHSYNCLGPTDYPQTGISG